MKRIQNFYLLIVLFFIFQSCKLLDNLTQFDIKMSQEVKIPPTLSIDIPFNIPTPPIILNTEKSFELNNTQKDLIQEIRLSELSLTVVSPSGEDFSILKSVEIYINAEGLSEIKIAYLEDIPASQSTIKLDVLTNDLKEYVTKNNFSLRIKTTTDEINTKEYEIKIDADFWVNALILGV